MMSTLTASIAGAIIAVCGRRGFPSREEWLERLRAHEQRLQADLKNVQDLIGSLAAPSAPASEV